MWEVYSESCCLCSLEMGRTGVMCRESGQGDWMLLSLCVSKLGHDGFAHLGCVRLTLLLP